YPRAGVDPTDDGTQRPGAARALLCPGDAGVPVQPRRQVRRGRGPARAGLGRRRPGTDPGAPAGVDRPDRAERRAMTELPTRMTELPTRGPGRPCLLVRRKT